MSETVQLSHGDATVRELTVDESIAVCKSMGNILEKLGTPSGLANVLAQDFGAIFTAIEPCITLPEQHTLGNLPFSDGQKIWEAFHKVNAPFLETVHQMAEYSRMMAAYQQHVLAELGDIQPPA